MAELLATYGPGVVAACFAVLFAAGFVKGTVGFALPMVAVSGVGSLMTAELAVAAILAPALVTNLQQAFRQGFGAAAATLRRFWRLNLTLVLLIGLIAQAVPLLPDRVFFLILGGVVTGVGLLQLIGWRPRFPPHRAGRAEWIGGGIAGVFGGLAGVWGPPIVLYLLAREVPKTEMVRAQGISYLIGSVILVGAHIPSGVLNGVTAPFTALLVIPALTGMALGVWVQDRLDQALFRKATLAVLILAGLNLLRRGLMG
ncbi:MAG: sulfite exporter TauE/SafE family protein [Pseudomonadota bacterium]